MFIYSLTPLPFYPIHYFLHSDVCACVDVLALWPMADSSINLLLVFLPAIIELPQVTKKKKVIFIFPKRKRILKTLEAISVRE